MYESALYLEEVGLVLSILCYTYNNLPHNSNSGLSMALYLSLARQWMVPGIVSGSQSMVPGR